MRFILIDQIKFLIEKQLFPVCVFYMQNEQKELTIFEILQRYASVELF